MENGIQEYPIFDASKLRVGILVSRYNLQIAQALLESAKDALFEYNIGSQDAETVFVAGPMEVPFALAHMARSGKFDCIVAVGSVLAETSSRFDVEVKTLQEGVARVVLDQNIPVGFGFAIARKKKQIVSQLYLAAEAAAGALELANLGSQVKVKKPTASKKKVKHEPTEEPT